MITIYGRATSSNVQAVMWGIAELGLSHERLDYGHVHGGLDTPDFRAMNPHGKVPVIRDGETVVWESGAILRYLAARYGDGGAFWPSDPIHRANVDMWAEWGKTEVAMNFTTPIFWPRIRVAARDRDEATLVQAIAEFESRLSVFDRHLSYAGPYACGDFSLADVWIGHVLFRYFDIDIPRGDCPAVQSYFDRLTERPAYRAHVMVDYSPLRHPEADG